MCMELMFFDFCYKTRTKLAAPEGNWRLPSSPIVERKHAIPLCEFKSVLIYTWIAKPFVLPLQIFNMSSFCSSKIYSLEKQIVFALGQFTCGNAHVFFHYWRRREPPVCLRCGDSRCSFAIFFTKMKTC